VNFQLIDWLVLAALFVAFNAGAYFCRKYIKSVADFLVAGRNVGRFLGAASDTMQGLGAISILWIWQMTYKAGFAGLWWGILTSITGMILAITGWGIYRFRQTRAMTLGQFVEMRYSKRARLFFGILAYLGGVLNMGIFPAVSAGFFVYYFGFPPKFSLAGLQIPTVVPIMVVLTASAVVICFFGGRVTIVVTDFVQAVFVNVMLIIITLAIYRMFTWDQFVEAFRSAPNGDALLHPFRSEGVSEFNKWYFFIFVFFLFYKIISWSPDTMQFGSAKDAHEAKMMRLIRAFRDVATSGMGLVLLSLAAFVLMNHPDFAAQAAQVRSVLAGITNKQVYSQMLTPVAVVHIIPAGLLGAFAGVVLAAFITTHDTYLLAWGGMLVQDVIIPLGIKPATPKQHLNWIRISVLIVAIITTLFSIFFKQVDNIPMFFDISASLYAASSGIILLGGLYWKRGTTTAAWVTMIVGAVVSITGFIYRSINPEFLNGTIMAFWITIMCIVIYVVVSLLGKNPDIDLDEILNRKKAGEDSTLSHQGKRRWFRWSSEVSRLDRIAISCVVAGLVIFLVTYISVCIYNLWHDVPTDSWLRYWHIYLYVMFCIGFIFLTFIIIGGFRDLYRLFKSLKTQAADVRDDGSVKGHHAAS
jgi:SSS family solute:Na+ symporter